MKTPSSSFTCGVIQKNINLLYSLRKLSEMKLELERTFFFFQLFSLFASDSFFQHNEHSFTHENFQSNPQTIGDKCRSLRIRDENENASKSTFKKHIQLSKIQLHKQRERDLRSEIQGKWSGEEGKESRSEVEAVVFDCWEKLLGKV